jgi:hypothetical protein
MGRRHQESILYHEILEARIADKSLIHTSATLQLMHFIRYSQILAPLIIIFNHQLTKAMKFKSTI